MTPIEPCPNCGAVAFATTNSPNRHWVYCGMPRCEMSGPYRHTAALAIATWNRLSKQMREGQRIHTLESAIKEIHAIAWDMPMSQATDMILAICDAHMPSAQTQEAPSEQS